MEENNRKQKNEFKNILKYGCKNLENAEEVLLECVKRGYRDMTTARATFSGLTKAYSEKDKDFRKIFYDKIKNVIKGFIEVANVDSFDEQHKKCCESIIQLFETEFIGYYNSNNKFHYGSVQKLINMTLKYFLLAAEDFEVDKNQGFISADTPKPNVYYKIQQLESKLHCPIDGIVLNELRKKKEIVFQTAWSKMIEKEYLELQNIIQSQVPNQSKLAFDFMVWNSRDE